MIEGDHTPVEGLPLPTRPRTPSYRYRLCRELDSGGMATVYLARMEGPGGFEKLVALKSIHPHLAKRQEIVEMFLDEAQIVAELNHPNVCTVLDFGCVGSTYFIAMEYLFGETLARLARRIRSTGNWPQRWQAFVAFIVAGAAEGLHAAHELRDASGNPRNVVHRDVTPNNICIAYDGSIRVMDFGIARAEGQLHETRDIALKGKIPYMAPEQFTEDCVVDRRTDVWSLGVVLWELLTLQRLFKRKSDPQTALAICQGPIPDPREVDGSIPEELASAAMAALSRNVNERLATTRELSRHLRGYLANLGEPIGMPEIAEMMAEVFPKARAERQALVDEAKRMTAPAPLESLSTQMMAMPEIPTGTPSESLFSLPPSTMSSMNSTSSVTPSNEASDSTDLETSLVAPANEVVQVALGTSESAPDLSNRPGRRWPLIAGPTAAIAVAIGAFVILGGDKNGGTTEPPDAVLEATVPSEDEENAKVAAGDRTKPDKPREVSTVTPPKYSNDNTGPEKVEENSLRATATEKRRDARDKKRAAREKRAQQRKSQEAERQAQARADERQRKLDEAARAASDRETRRLAQAAQAKNDEQTRKAAAARQAALEAEKRKRQAERAKPVPLVPFRTSIGVKVAGPLPSNEVVRKVKGQRSAIAACYASARKRVGQDRFGSVSARFSIGSARRAKGVRVSNGKFKSLSGCITSHLQNVRTVNASDTGDTTVSVTITFARK